MTPPKLASRIATRITRATEPVSFATLEKRAKEIGIAPNIFLSAMDIIHRSKMIEARTQKGELVYVLKPKRTPLAPPKLPEYPRKGSWQYGDKIPLYWPEHDGPSEIYCRETDIFYQEKNAALKRVADNEKYSRV